MGKRLKFDLLFEMLCSRSKEQVFRSVEKVERNSVHMRREGSKEAQEGKGIIHQRLIEKALELGATRAAVIDVKAIVFDRVFRDMCASNACGMYGKCYMCPPDVGEIDTLMQEAKQYDYALVYQTVSELEDSYDFEGMLEARRRMPKLSQSLRKTFEDASFSRVLHLSVGNCGVCKICAKKTGEPCRFPKLALPSLEAYGINVSELAKSAGMKYINGQDTVTYFGAVLFSLDGEEG